jgi:membrane-bound serine protease (ClpP class)
LNPFVSGILLLLIFGGLYFELQTPGVGFPIIASITALLLYLIPYYLNGVAENWEIILLFFGIILIAVEVFIIPGFGVFGLLGLFTSISSLILIMLNNDLFDFTFVVSSDVVSASLSVLISIFLLGIIILFGGIKLTDTDAFKKIALEETQDSKKGYISNNYPKEIVGKIGKSYTILRPSGKVIIDDSIYDATSSDGFVEKNSKIKVIGNEGSALKVRKV